MISQKNLIVKIRKYFLNSNNNVINPKFYLNTFAISPGFFVLKKLCNEVPNILELLQYKIMFFFSISKLSNYKIFFSSKNNDYDKIFITWGHGKNFSKNGSFNDSYLNTNSKKSKNILWIIISLDGNKPKKIDENIALFIRQNNNYTDIPYLIKIFFNNLKNILMFKFQNCHWSYQNHFAEIFWNKIDETLNFTKVKRLITLYEAQPFQNYLNLMFKKKDNQIKTIGYVHSTEAFPVHLYKREGAPDYLLVHGNDQKYHCVKHLNWEKKLVKVIPSLRFKRKNTKEINNKVILPYDFRDIEFFKKKFNILINLNKNIQLNNLDVKIHPYKLNSKKHKLLKSEIQNIIKTNRKKFLKYKNGNSKSIILGSSSTVLEALENKICVYHICHDAKLQSYSSDFWPNIKRKVIDEDIFEYKLYKKNSCINYKKLKYNPFRYL